MRDKVVHYRGYVIYPMFYDELHVYRVKLKASGYPLGDFKTVEEAKGLVDWYKESYNE